MNFRALLRMLQYSSELTLGGQRNNLMRPSLFIAAHTISPSGFWVVLMVYLAAYLEPPAGTQQLK